MKKENTGDFDLGKFLIVLLVASILLLLAGVFSPIIRLIIAESIN